MKRRTKEEKEERLASFFQELHFQLLNNKKIIMKKINFIKICIGGKIGKNGGCPLILERRKEW